MFIKNLLMTGFEPQSSGFGPDHSTNWSTTNAQMTILLINNFNTKIFWSSKRRRRSTERDVNDVKMSTTFRSTLENVFYWFLKHLDWFESWGREFSIKRRQKYFLDSGILRPVRQFTWMLPEWSGPARIGPLYAVAVPWWANEWANLSNNFERELKQLAFILHTIEMGKSTNGQFPTLFLYFRHSTQSTLNKCLIKIANDCILTGSGNDCGTTNVKRQSKLI